MLRHHVAPQIGGIIEQVCIGFSPMRLAIGFPADRSSSAAVSMVRIPRSRIEVRLQQRREPAFMLA